MTVEKIKEIKNVYTLSMESETGSAKITEVIDAEYDDIYAMGRILYQFLLSLGYDDDVIERILNMENI